MCMAKTDWERCIEFHGHSCPGLAIGYRVAVAALDKMGELRSSDEELVCITENDACGVDAIMLLTGCTLGKGNLIFRDYGKQVYTFGSRNSGKALRLAVKDSAWRGQVNDGFSRLRNKVFGGTATVDETKEFNSYMEERVRKILEIPLDELLKVENIEINLPPKARIFASVNCVYCNESVAESRARVRDGKFACIPCAGEYSRGW